MPALLARPFSLVGCDTGVSSLVSLPAACLLAASCATAHGGFGGGRSATAPGAHCRSGSAAPVGSGRIAVAAIVRRHARAYRRPGRRPFASFRRLNLNGFPTFFRVLASVRRRDCRPAWYRVQLPAPAERRHGVRPGGAVGLGRVRTRIRVDVSARRLTLFRDGRPVLRTRVAVGSRATPTPTGSYYVNQRLVPANPAGPYGPAALGISAFSNVLTRLGAGRARRDPRHERALVDRPRRLERLHPRPQPCAERLFAATPAGTPVTIAP